MVIPSLAWSGVLLLSIFNIGWTNADDELTVDDDSLVRSQRAFESYYAQADNPYFVATRGKKSAGGEGNPPIDLLFWPNRGKRSEEELVNAPRPNGFFFPSKFGKRSVNFPKPNSFFFPSASAKREAFNFPKPNGFMFPSSTGKRAEAFNIPRPNGFMFPSKMGKRSEGEAFNVPRPNGFFFPSAGKRDTVYNVPKPNGFFMPMGTRGKRSQMMAWNTMRPTGFFFPTMPPPATSEESDEGKCDCEYLNNILESLGYYEEAPGKRGSFYAGRGKRVFFAGRGKKSDEEVKRDEPEVSFYAGRGKRDTDDKEE